MVMPARPFLPQHPDYHPGRRLPWWARPSAAIGHAAWFRAMAEVEACSPDRGGSPAPTVWRAYADTVGESLPIGLDRLLMSAGPIAVDATGRVTVNGHDLSELIADDAGRFTRTQDPA